MQYLKQELPFLTRLIVQDLIDLVKEVGHSTTEFVRSTGGGGIGTRDSSSAANDVLLKESYSTDSAAHFGLRDLDSHGSDLSSRLRDLIHFLQTRAHAGSQAYQKAASTVSAVIADLDTNIMFASSGTMHRPLRDDGDAQMMHYDRAAGHHFSEARESITRAARAIVDDTRSLVSGASEEQTRLAYSTHYAVHNITNLAETVKQSSAMLAPGQPDAQVC
ncbi:Talin-1 [Cichlidogyrus casuarinus]|uniref:Talin-1 n=1 Tax=Cichlidogyrus casuarinus TaxID=1844966 RepID=A0ABD2Q035_9PLAT